MQNYNLKVKNQMLKKLLKQKHLLIVLAFTFVGAILRFYNLDGTLQFLGDQGRDALITYNMLINKDPVLIGPVTSVGNMYLGPGYYYFMLPFYAITYPSPMGPVYAVALLGVLTIPLIYFLGKELVGSRAALFATILYSITWSYIELTRFSWNPNPAPIVSLIMIWSVFRAWTRSPKYWILTGITFSILIQLHYLILLSGVAAGICWLVALIKPIKVNKHFSKVKIAIATFLAVIVFLVSLAPLALFDLRHNFLNVKAFQQLIFGEEEHLRPARNWIDILMETHGRSLQIFFETTIGEMRTFNTVVLFIVAILFISAWFLPQFRQYRKGVFILGVWVAVGILGTAMYRSTVFTHYIAYLFPVTALILGTILSVISQHQVGKFIAVGCISLYFWANMQKYSYKDLGWTIHDMKRTSDVVYNALGKEEKYNIVLLASHGDIEGMNYRYFLTTTDHPPASKEEWGDIDTLVVINEDKKLQNVADSPIYEIVVFPNKQPSEVIAIPEGPNITIFRR